METWTCKHCEKKFKNPNHDRNVKRRGYRRAFCSVKCYVDHSGRKIVKPCGWCGDRVARKLKEFRKSKSGNIFCNHSCAMSFANTQRRKSRRSKCEMKLFDLLKQEFPNLDLISNDKKLLHGYECDIAIPSLKLAIEWNGIVHFKPIYGQAKLNKVQQRDTEKQKMAQDAGVSLIVIPDLVSTEQKVKESFLEIKKILLNLLS